MPNVPPQELRHLTLLLINSDWQVLPVGSRDVPTDVRVVEFLVWGLKTLKSLRNTHVFYYGDVITPVDVAVTSQTSSFTLEPGHRVHHIYFKDGRFTPTGR